MGSTTSVIKLVGISAIAPGTGVGLLVARAFHPDTGKVIDAGVEAGSRQAASLSRTAIRQGGRASGRVLQRVIRSARPSVKPPRAGDHGVGL
jgi:hypothetical protein